MSADQKPIIIETIDPWDDIDLDCEWAAFPEPYHPGDLISFDEEDIPF